MGNYNGMGLEGGRYAPPGSAEWKAPQPNEGLRIKQPGVDQSEARQAELHLVAPGEKPVKVAEVPLVPGVVSALPVEQSDRAEVIPAPGERRPVVEKQKPAGVRE